ncbi:MAG TPA: exodeoxyribonuclease V subunit gamma [Solirubrobacteraceae bacterium]|nr:exodeoxyribonuclease V subunit gamma [Solirubrobacteraceae bacterium]
MLHIHRASRADGLADALAALLSESPADPFAPEVVAVPTRGMERWLTQRMSSVLGARQGRADGICANVEFPTPHRLVTDAVAAASGIDPAEDPWLPERSVWPLLTVVQESLSEPWLATLAAYLGAQTALASTPAATPTPSTTTAAEDAMRPARQSRRLTTVRHLAGLFDHYSLHRPEMLAAWARGEDLDAVGAPLPTASQWQAELWRRLRARIGVPDLAERTGRACERIADDPDLLELPSRVALFGLTRIPAGHLEIMRALASGRDLHLFLLHPSPALWDKVTQRDAGAPVVRRDGDRTVTLASNRLLASWGRDSREMQLVLTAGAPGTSDTHHASPRAPDTLLGRIQQGIREDQAAPGVPLPGAPDARPLLAHEDRSIVIHSCHGRARQVEVIRDAILHVLAEDPSLEPRDVIVMCPDIETFAPLIQATFGAGETFSAGETSGDGAIDLRVRLADRSLRQTNPVLGVVAQLLELAEQRLTASQLLDLADRGPVRRRFRLDDDDLTRLADWISQAGIRWGLDAAHRAPYKLDTLSNGTWQTGLERLLLGVTMTEDDQRLFAGVLPLDDVDSRAIDLAGRFTELVTRVGQAVRALSARQTLAAWAEAIAEAADALTDTPLRDRWQRTELQRVLDELVSEAGDAAPPELAPAEVRALLARRLEGRPTRANFRTGHLTVCTLQPMRSVPHRVVCLLGLDDGAFPRKAPRDGDDLMLDSPHLGERDPRSEDRQLLLDALLAAEERLIVTYSGNDERTNARRAAAVPVGELLDAIDATVRCEDGQAAHERVVIRHPLQPFDPRNFVAGDIAGPEPWSFDPTALAGARALTGSRTEPAPFLSAPLSPRPAAVVELADLVRFVEHPVRAFLRQRLGISLYSAADEIEDELSVELDGLQRWGVGQRLLEARLRGIDERTAILAEIARGTLPPGVLGKPVIDDLSPIVSGIVERTRAVATASAGGGGATTAAAANDPIDVRVTLDDGRLLSGTVTGVTGDLLLATTFSRVSAKHRIAAWVRLLALTASSSERPFAAATVGRGQGRGDVRTAWVQPLGDDAAQRRAVAQAELTVLMDLYDRGMREPLPMFCLTSAAYAQAARQGQDAYSAALKEWETEWNFEHEDRDAEHQMALGGVLTLSEVLTIEPADGEAGDGWPDSEGSRFGRLARRLWEGLLAREEVRAQ